MSLKTVVSHTFPAMFDSDSHVQNHMTPEERSARIFTVQVRRCRMFKFDDSKQTREKVEIDLTDTSAVLYKLVI